ncbi:SpoIIE family protein phosphatase [Williamwhitmania taraxaci]|uniref:Stage II sporulation protein E (SpoIIE) n=1 Tax=Williamwhitmania taraxaci TaxID=1640674 RepID=A0A1G6GGC3_9BACT|nr:SpoIIE family protein phosphatase [Williamwhitmania taraxaci]SDB81014.1 Stage II sporulation protein E (SpoIIE) [Williamwhitmania taraxaci]
MKSSNFHIEVECFQLNKEGNQLCGDVFLSRKIKNEDRIVIAFSDGLGSGVKANVLATLTTSMAVNFTTCNVPVEKAAVTIMDTLPVDSKRMISYATFTIADIDSDGETKIVEFDNPRYLLIRNGASMSIQREEIIIKERSEKHRRMFQSVIRMEKEDRLVMFSDGVTQAGIGTNEMPFGWEDDGVEEFVLKCIAENETISAYDLARKVVQKANANDVYCPKDDISCAVSYFREPRRLMVCSGPPFREDKDGYLAHLVDSYPGKKIVCGGTTSQIISRELNRPIDVGMMPDKSGLPPASRMEGIDLITEGILTIGKVAEILEELTSSGVTGEGPAVDITKMLLKSDLIDFMIGTKINNAHQDPNLPVELEIRRNVIKRIVRVLEEKFLKEVNLQFI